MDMTEREKFIYLSKAYLKRAHEEVRRWEGHLEEFGEFKKEHSLLPLDEWTEKIRLYIRNSCQRLSSNPSTLQIGGFP